MQASGVSVARSKPHGYWRWLDHTITYTEFKKEMWAYIHEDARAAGRRAVQNESVAAANEPSVLNARKKRLHKSFISKSAPYGGLGHDRCLSGKCGPLNGRSAGWLDSSLLVTGFTAGCDENHRAA